MDIQNTDRIAYLSRILGQLLPMKEEYREKLENKFRLEFSYNSNHLEGNTLSYGETVLLLIFGETKGIPHNIREYEEMKAHDVAYALIKEWAADKERPLTEAYIKNLNKVILVEPFWKEAITADGQTTRRQIKVGAYKEFPNSVRLPNGEIFNYASTSETPIRMGELIDWYRLEQERGQLHPVELAARFHYDFVCIHPFDDGNGRIARLLMNYVLLRNDLPPVIIKSEDKRNYLNALHQADSGDIGFFIDYIGLQLRWSLEMSIKAAKGESLDEPGDLDKKLALLKSSIGEKPDLKIVAKKDAKSIRDTIENSMKPLALAWEEKLKDFDPFFSSREVGVVVAGQIRSGSKGKNLSTLLAAECAASIYPKLEKNILPELIQLDCSPKGLRPSKQNITLNGGFIIFRFFDHLYEITYSLSGSEQKMDKLYHQMLTKEEIDRIVESVGTLLYDAITANLDKK
jgi:Fic family protein